MLIQSKNIIDKIDKERRHSMNAAPTRVVGILIGKSNFLALTIIENIAFLTCSNKFKFSMLMNSTDRSILLKLAVFCKTIISAFK
jgi:hypothetical protein